MAGKEKASADTADDKQLATVEESSALVDAGGFFDGASGEGMEDFGQKDFTVPFIGIVQALSKAKQKNHANYVQGAEEGMFLNSATRALYDGGQPGRDKNGEWHEGGILVVPVHFEHRYVAWRPNNGGIAHDYGSDPTIFDSLTPVAEEGPNKGKRLDPEGNEVVDTMQYFVLIIDPEKQSMEAAVIPFSKIHSRKSKKWNNLIRAQSEIHQGKPFKPAIYFYVYRMTTQPENNERGSWMGHVIEEYEKLPNMGDFGKLVFAAAKELREQVKSGEVRAATEEPDAPAGVGDGGGAF